MIKDIKKYNQGVFGMAYLSNLQSLSTYMRQNNRFATSFVINYHKHPFSNLFIDDYAAPALYISSLGKNAFTIKLIGNEQFNFKVYLGEQYHNLCQYLDLKSNPQNPFSTNDFFEKYDKQIPTNSVNTPTPRDIATIVNLHENSDELGKIYFCGWIVHGNKVQQQNFKKTCGLIGYNNAIRLCELGISSKWSANPNEERLAEIAKYVDY